MDPAPQGAAALPPVRFSVRVKLAAFVAVVALLAGGLPAGYAIFHARDAARRRIDGQLRQLGSIIATGGLFADGRGGIDASALAAFVKNAPALKLPLAYVVFVDPSGKPDAARSAVNERSLSEVAPALAGEWKGGAHQKVLARLAGNAGLPEVTSLSVRIQSTGGELIGHLRIGMSTALADRRAREVLMRSGGIVGALFLVALFFGIALSGPAVKPLKRLADAMAGVADGDLDAEIEGRGRDEIGRLGAAFNLMVAGLRQRERLRATLGRYVSDEVASRILSETDDLDLAGETRKVTVLFLDMRDFSSLVEHLKPRDVLELINAYFAIIVDAVSRHHGVINKFIGDAVMAVWGAPKALPDPELQAISAAWEIQKRLGGHNWNRLQAGLPVVNVGIGINTGPAVAGNVGTERRLEYTVLGHEVNMAQRLESIARPGQILVSEATHAAVAGRIQAQALDPVKVKGKHEPVVPYEIIGIGDAVAEEAG